MRGRAGASFSLFSLVLFLAATGSLEGVAAARTGPSAGLHTDEPKTTATRAPWLSPVGKMLMNKAAPGVLEDRARAEQLAHIQGDMIRRINTTRVSEGAAAVAAMGMSFCIKGMVEGLLNTFDIMLDAIFPAHADTLRTMAKTAGSPGIKMLLGYKQDKGLQNILHLLDNIEDFNSVQMGPYDKPAVVIPPVAAADLDRMLSNHLKNLYTTQSRDDFARHHVHFLQQVTKTPSLHPLIRIVPPTADAWMHLLTTLPTVRRTVDADAIHRVHKRVFPADWPGTSFLETGMSYHPDGSKKETSPGAGAGDDSKQTDNKTKDERTAAWANAGKKAKDAAKKVTSEEEEDDEGAVDEAADYFCHMGDMGDNSLSCRLDSKLKPVFYIALFSLALGGFLGIYADRSRDNYQLVTDENGNKTCVKRVRSESAMYASTLEEHESVLLDRKIMICDKPMLEALGVIMVDLSMWLFLAYIGVAMIVSATEARKYYQLMLPPLGGLIEAREARQGMGQQILDDLHTEDTTSTNSSNNNHKGRVKHHDPLIDDPDGKPYELVLHNAADALSLLQTSLEEDQDYAASRDKQKAAESEQTTENAFGGLDGKYEEGKDIDDDLLDAPIKGENAKEFIKEIKSALLKGKGKVNAGDLDKMMSNLGLPQEIVEYMDRILSIESRGILFRATAGMNWNPLMTYSPYDIHYRATQSDSISLVYQQKSNTVSITVMFAVWVACFICLTSTGDRNGMTVAILGLFAIHAVLHHVQTIYTESHHVNELAEKFDAASMAKTSQKIMITMVTVMGFALLYFFTKRCTFSTVSCPSANQKPVCTRTGLPIRRYNCDNGNIWCDYSVRSKWDEKDGPASCRASQVAICLSEEPVNGLSDNFYFVKNLRDGVEQFCSEMDCNMIPGMSKQLYKLTGSIVKREYYVGLTADAQTCIYAGENNAIWYKPFVNDQTHYTYAVAGMQTMIGNLFAANTTTRAELPDQGPHGIVGIALVPDGYSCSDSDKVGSVSDMNATQTKSALLNASQLEVFTPNGASGNFRLCYQRNEVWRMVNNSYVVVGDQATCSDPDCTDADFTDGLGYHLSDAIYYSLITQSTIGYGDILAISDRARMMTAMQALIMMFIGLL